MTTALIHSPHFLDHDTGPGHPERPDRLRAVTRALRDHGLWDRLIHLDFGPATSATITRVHAPAYIDRLVEACHLGRGYIDSPDSVIGLASEEIARLAAGGAVAAADAVAGGVVDRAFCAVRPPGHHAEADRSMGFCLYNNIAIAAAHLIAQHGLERVAIVDFDVHHGNGTQHIFEHRDDVLFASLHQDPLTLYPGTGHARETGVAGGEGYTINVPLPAGADDAVCLRAWRQQVRPRVLAYRPQALLISAGFDAAAADPLAHLEVSVDGFEQLTRELRDVAEQCCDGRIISMLEGGYDLNALGEGVARHVELLL
ncbi:MAG: histone deacetylase [Phycisphaeraceae bacterium]